MRLWQTIRRLSQRRALQRPIRSPGTRRPATRSLFLEALEDRLCPSTTINIGALTLPSVILDGTSTLAVNSTQSLNLAAGGHTLTSSASGYGGSVSFSV